MVTQMGVRVEDHGKKARAPVRDGAGDEDIGSDARWESQKSGSPTELGISYRQGRTPDVHSQGRSRFGPYLPALHSGTQEVVRRNQRSGRGQGRTFRAHRRLH